MYGEDENFFCDLYGANYKKLYRYVQKLVRDDSQAEDIVQEVYCIACHKREKLMIHENPIGWLYKAAQYKVYQYWLAAGKVIVGLEKVPETFREADCYGMAELQATIKTVLTEEELKVLYQYYLGGYSGREIAAELGITESCFKVRILRMKRKILQIIQRQEV